MNRIRDIYDPAPLTGLKPGMGLMNWIRQIVEDLKREEEHRRWVEERKRLLNEEEKHNGSTSHSGR